MIPLTVETKLNVRLRWLRENNSLFTIYSVLDIYTQDYCERFNITRKPMTRCIAMFDYRSRRKRVWSIIEVRPGVGIHYAAYSKVTLEETDHTKIYD